MYVREGAVLECPLPADSRGNYEAFRYFFWVILWGLSIHRSGVSLDYVCLQ